MRCRARGAPAGIGERSSHTGSPRPEVSVPSVLPAQVPRPLPWTPYHWPEPRQETAGGSGAGEGPTRSGAASLTTSVPDPGHEAAGCSASGPIALLREAGGWPARTQGPQNGACRRQLCPQRLLQELAPNRRVWPAADGPFLMRHRGWSRDQAAHRSAAALAPRQENAGREEKAGREVPGPPALCSHLFGSCWSCLFAHPVPSLGTITMLGSFPLFSDFKLGRFAGGGIRRAVATFPRLCKPCLGITRETGKEADSARAGDRPEARPFSCSFKPQVIVTKATEQTRGVAPPGRQTALPGGHFSHLTSPSPRPWKTRKLPFPQRAEG